MVWSPVFTQTIYYFITMVLSIVIISFMQRGFFWQFVKVKLSFGKKILIEKREAPSYSYRVGYTEGGFLKFKDKKEKRSFINRVALPKNKNVFYKSMGCWRVDLDPETNSLLEPNLAGIQSYDPLRFDELMCATIEANETGKEKYIIIGLIVVAIGVGVAIYLLFRNSEALTNMANVCANCAKCTTQIANNTPPPANI